MKTIPNSDSDNLNPEQRKKLQKRHFRGALVRSGASLFMWIFAFSAFLIDSVQMKHLIGISISVAFLILMNPPTLLALRYVTSKRVYEYVSIVINLLEIVGYTAIIYVLGGINALFLSPIYAALIAYVGVVGPPSLPFKIAGVCGMTLSLMVGLEFLGVIPQQDPLWKNQLPGLNQTIIVFTEICLLYVVAFISSYTGTLLKQNKKRLREQNIDLDRSRTELKAAADGLEKKNVELQLAAKSARESDRMKSEFLANMSHELRTPLNHIIGFTELMVDNRVGDLNEIQREYLNDVLQSSKYLFSLINDILDLSKTEAGKLELEVSDVNIRMLLENSLLMVKETANKHGIELSVNTNGVIETITADDRRLKQVMYNLLSNAVKFTKDGGTVSISTQMVDRFVRPGLRSGDSNNLLIVQKPASLDAAESTGRKKCVEFAVSDNGIGIRSEDRERIFNRFEQVDGSLKKNYQGVGLGLSLCKSIVEMHGGRLWVESEGVGKGSTFRFLIPT